MCISIITIITTIETRIIIWLSFRFGIHIDIVVAIIIIKCVTGASFIFERVFALILAARKFSFSHVAIIASSMLFEEAVAIVASSVLFKVASCKDGHLAV